jgi:large subunit ribosomal protein L22
MQVSSTYRYARISAFKAREVTRAIQGRSASDALDLLAFSPKKAAFLVKKTLKSAIANAENNASLKVDTLLVKEAVVGEGPTYKRFRARARGSASPLRKRTSHIRIILSDDLGPDGQKKPVREVKEIASPATETEHAETAKGKARTAKPSGGRSQAKKGTTDRAKRRASAQAEDKPATDKKTGKKPPKTKE